MLDWLFKQEQELKFPTKKGVNIVACVSLLDLHGSLFCLDNQNILFYQNDVPKVLKPVKVEPAFGDTKYSDFDAYVAGDYFAIRYNDNDYFYHAAFEVVGSLNNQSIH